MSKKKKLYLYLSLLIGSITLPAIESNKQYDDSFYYEEAYDDEAKIICNFLNKKGTDIISIIDENNIICATIKNKDTYIYLKEGKYRICSKLEFNQEIVIDDKNDIFQITFDYSNHNIKLSKINDVTLEEDKTNIEDISFNILASDIDFEQDSIKSEIDYSNIKKDEFTPQGYTIIAGEESSILISSYSKKEKSRIYIYDKETGNYLGYISLNNSAHVGGITYDSINDILFVTNQDGLINTYDYSIIMKSLKNGQKITDKPIVIDLGLNENQNNKDIIIKNDLNVLQTAATITYFNNSLYSIDFGLNGVLVKTNYECLNNEIISIDNKVILLEDSKCIQGMTFYESDDKTYLITSTSLGILKSKLNIYEVNDTYEWHKIAEKVFDKTVQIEGITSDKYGNIKAIYEGNITKSKTIANVKNIINNNKEDKINNLAYNVGGLIWDINHHDSIPLYKAKKLIKKQ